MKFQIDAAAGVIKEAAGVHVSLEECASCQGEGAECEECNATGFARNGLGIHVQPVSGIALQTMQDEWNAEIKSNVADYAELIGKTPKELTPEDLQQVPLRLSATLIDNIYSVLATTFLRWDAGLVDDGADPPSVFGPDDVVGEDGTTAFQLWARHMCEHRTPLVINRIFPAANDRAVALEGNSSRPSGGTGDTDEAPSPTGGPESTAIEGRSARSSELPKASAPTSEASEIRA